MKNRNLYSMSKITTMSAKKESPAPTKESPKKKKPGKGKDQEIVFTPDGGAEGEGEGAPAGAPGFNPMFLDRYLSIVRDNYYTMNRTLWLQAEIDVHTCQEVIKFLNFWDDGSKEPVTIYVCSPGGSVDFGFAIIDAIQNLQAHGIKVTTICVGNCASMASLILAAGSKGHRYSYPSARIMIHQPYYIFAPDGTIDGMTTYKNELESSLEKAVELLTRQTKRSKKQIIEALNTGDNFMSAEEAKAFGIIDKIEVYTN